MRRNAALVGLAVAVALLIGIAVYAALVGSGSHSRQGETAAPTPSASPRPPGAPTHRAPDGPTEATHRPPRVAGSPTPAARPAPRPVDLRVLDWNIHSLTHGAAGVAADIRALRPEVVLLQEVADSPRLGDNVATLATRLGMPHRAYGVNARLGRHHLLGNALLSRYPILRWRNSPLPGAPGTQPRGILSALLNVRGNRVRIYVTHLHFHGRVRMTQARAVMRHVGVPACQTILGGDMNVGPNTAMYAVLRSTMVDSFDGIPRAAAATVPAVSPRGRIDYLFHSLDLAVSDPRVMPLGHSDHRGISAVFHLKPGASCR